MTNTNRFSSGLPDASGDFFKFKEGQNRLRIMSDGAVISKHFLHSDPKKYGVCYGKDKGCLGCKDGIQLTYRKMFWILDRDAKGQLKLAEFGSKILKQLDAIGNNPDYEFSDFPMEFDLTINAQSAGTKDVVYTVMPSPKHTPLTADELESFAAKETTESIVSKMKESQMRKDNTYVEAPPADDVPDESYDDEQ